MNGKQSIWTLAIVSVALFMVTLDNLVVTNALVSIREDLGASLEQLEWTVNAYTLSYAVFLLTAAALGDRLGRRRVFVAGLAHLHGRLGRWRRWRPSTEALIAARGAAGTRRRGDHAAVAHAAERGVRRRRSAGLRSESGPACPDSASRSARWSAARSSRASPGSGSSG